MEDGPSNASVAAARRQVPLLNDRDFMVRQGLSLCTEDFVRYDRRRLTAQPPGDRQAWLDAMFAFEELAGGSWPSFEMTEVIAVRGDRLILARWTMGLGTAGEIQFAIVTQLDESIDKIQIICFFDPEDVDVAIAELDRLHDELTHG